MFGLGRFHEFGRFHCLSGGFFGWWHLMSDPMRDPNWFLHWRLHQPDDEENIYMGVSENGGLKPPKSSNLIGISIINHPPFWGKHPYFWKHPYISKTFPTIASVYSEFSGAASHHQYYGSLQVKSNRTYWTWNCIYQTLTLLRWPTAKGVKQLYYFKDVLKKKLKESSCLLLNTVDWKKNPAQLGTYKTLWKMGSLGYQQNRQKGISIRKSALKDSKVESEFLGADEAFGKKWMKFGWVLKHYCIWLGGFPNSGK